MPEVGIVADSIACLPPELVSQYDVQVVPLNIHYQGRGYREGIDISVAQAYKLLAEAPDEFRTSPSSAGDYLNVFREMSARYPSILCITLSCYLSTLYEMARLAREMAAAEFPGTRIEVVDSVTASAGETLVVLAAARAVQAGKNLDDVIAVVEQVKDKVRVFGIFDTIRHVYRSGRVPKAAARMISTVNVKPLFSISGGTVHITSVDTSKERGIGRLLGRIKKEVGERQVHAVVSHANVPEEGQRLRERVVAEFNCEECLLTDFSPIMGYATGEGTLIIAYYPADLGCG